MPRGAQENALKAERALRELATCSFHMPTVADAAEYLEWTIEEVLDALEAGAAHHVASLDAPCLGDHGDEWSLVDALGTEDERLNNVEALVSIAAAWRLLQVRERRVIHMRFIEELTRSQIAERIGTSQMQVSRILCSGVDHLAELTRAAR